MKYLVLRHAEADPLFGLTQKGEKAANDFAAKVKEIMGGDIAPENTLIITSNVPRARITGEVIQQHLGLPKNALKENANVYGGDVDKIRAAIEFILNVPTGIENVIVVSHEAGAPYITEKLGGPASEDGKVWENLEYKFFETPKT